MIIGAQKCGTSAMWHSLCANPSVSKTRKEKRFFCLDSEYEKGLPYYSQKFSSYKKLNGDATPAYLFSEVTPERVFDVIPDIKLIVSFRNPTDRAYSQYHHAKQKLGGLSFEEALKEKKDLIKRGLYAHQMKNWLQFFPMESFLIIDFMDLGKDFAKTMSEIETFIGAEQFGVDIAGKRFTNYPPMRSDTRKELDDFFTPHNEELFELIQRRFQWE